MGIERLYYILLIACSCLLLAGCASKPQARGVLYTRVLYPHMQDFDHTPVGNFSCVIDDHRIREVFTGADLTVGWTETVIRVATEECGFSTLTHVDEELSSLLGIYERRRLIVYGN